MTKRFLARFFDTWNRSCLYTCVHSFFCCGSRLTLKLHDTALFVTNLPYLGIGFSDRVPTLPSLPTATATLSAARAPQRNQFTDMGNASLKCMVCLKLLAGEKGALEHARATKHQNFGQI